jgi:hypothetical protein
MVDVSMLRTAAENEMRYFRDACSQVSIQNVLAGEENEPSGILADPAKGAKYSRGAREYFAVSR